MNPWDDTAFVEYVIIFGFSALGFLLFSAELIRTRFRASYMFWFVWLMFLDHLSSYGGSLYARYLKSVDPVRNAEFLDSNFWSTRLYPVIFVVAGISLQALYKTIKRIKQDG